MKNLLIDGSSLLHRAHWISNQQSSKTKSGHEVGDILIFLRCLKSYINMFNTTSVYICWDKKIEYPSRNFRNELLEDTYKGQRDKSLTADVYSNEKDLFEIIESLGIRNMFPVTLEADDIIAWLSYKLENNVIITADNDLLQLISETTSFYHPMKKKIINLENFEQEVGMPIQLFLYYKAIKGDTSDNIPGWSGYGPKKSIIAAKELFENSSLIKNYSEEQQVMFDRNLKLMDLSLGFNLAGQKETISYQEQFETKVNIDLDKFKRYCTQFEFNQFLNKFDEWEKLFNQSRILSILENLF